MNTLSRPAGATELQVGADNAFCAGDSNLADCPFCTGPETD